jgi:hypothetical protein
MPLLLTTHAHSFSDACFQTTHNSSYKGSLLSQQLITYGGSRSPVDATRLPAVSYRKMPSLLTLTPRATSRLLPAGTVGMTAAAHGQRQSGQLFLDITDILLLMR